MGRKMSFTRKESRKKDIAEAMRRKTLRRDMRLGLAFDTPEGRKRQKGILEV